MYGCHLEERLLLGIGALALERVIPVTAWPWRTNSATSGRPIAPVAPATKTFMVVSPFLSE